jgi:hypothetical protein
MLSFGEKHVLYYSATPDINGLEIFASRSHFRSHENERAAGIMCSLKTQGFETKTKINNLNHSIICEHDIFKFKISMDNIKVMDIL